MRVSLRNQYSTFLYNLQDTQSRLMDLNLQASSQKRINKPSDDAVGTAKVLNYRGSLAAIGQYQSNIDTATGWLNLADESMLQVSTILTTLKGLAEQGATGTMTASDREATSYQVRQLFNQLVSLSNTQYEGNSIFAGHKTAEDAFEEGLMVYDQDGNNLGLATGASTRSVLVQFVGEEGTSATVGTTSNIAYRYTSDGGTTWKTGSLDATAPHVLDLGGVSVTLADGYEVALTPASNTKTSSGSWLTVAPTAIYQGDHEKQSAVVYGSANPTFSALPLGGFSQDVQVAIPGGVTLGSGTAFDVDITVNGETWTASVDNSTATPVIQTPYGGIQLSGTAPASAQTFTVRSKATGVQSFGADVNAVGEGIFGGDVLVRIDADAVIGSGSAIAYSYSTDGGVNWSTRHTAANTGSPAELLVPGGKLVLSARGTSDSLAAGDQLIIHPQTAGRDLEISAGEFLRINNVGSEIFGGYYSGGSEPVFSESNGAKNIFVTVGKLVAALENNDQQGCADALDDLQAAQEYFSTQLASVGARENRLDVAGTILSGLKLNETERMSNIEDVDLATLLTELANQQLSYEAVLKSSSMIMKMSLVNYL
jgi:flagellar hook-associated protein 3 FlgL